MAEEDFDSFEDEESSFVIKTKKPKIVIAKDSTQEQGAVQFSKVSMAKNEAISMSIKNFLIFSKLKDIKARYLVLDLELNNILKSQKVVVSNGANHPSSWINKSADEYEYKEAVPLYQIPDIMQHLYLRVNNQQEQALDVMSLLLDKPLMDFNSNKIEVLPKKFKEGQLAFRLPKNKKIEQLSLHYYDSKYGNIDIPIVGEMKQKAVEVTTLPQTPWKKMNDNFSLSVTGYEVQDKIKEHHAKKDGQFEIVEIDIESQVYALLAFEPSKRFYLNVGGVHQLKLHPITQALPIGLYGSASLSPGSNNKFRLAFYVPKGMEKQSRSLLVELKGEDLVIPFKKGVDGSSSKTLAKSAVEGTSLTVNGVYAHNNKTLIDITFNDEDDAYATRLSKAFLLNNEEAQTSQSILGMHKKEVILNGSTKRVLVSFNTQVDAKKPSYLTSNIFKSLKFQIDKNPESLPEKLQYFLTKNYPYKHTLDSVDKKVLAMVKTFKAQKSKEAKANANNQPIATLESTKEKSRYTSIAPLSASAYGEEKIRKLKTVDDLINALKTLKWVPSAYEVSTAIYSTPAIFTQGWSSENEMFNAIYAKVKEQDVQFGSYVLNDKGQKELKVLAKNIPINKSIPFIEWEEKGKKRSLVLPFLKPINQVEKYVEKKQYLKSIKKQQATIEMKLTYTPKNDGRSVGSFGMFGGALNGATTTEKTNVIFKKSWNLAEISDTPVDVYFPSTIASYVDYKGIQQDRVHALNAKKVEPKALHISVTMPDGKVDTYSHYFKKKQNLKDVFFTIAMASPDLPQEVLKHMDISKQKQFKGVKEITEFSTLQWVNRDKIYKFIGLQTAYENDLTSHLAVQVSRSTKARVVIAKIERKPDKKIVSSIDLRDIYPAVYGDKDAIKSFNLMSGLFATQSEGKVLNGTNVFSLWEETKSLNILTILPSKKKSYLKHMSKISVPKEIIERLKKSKNVWLFPDKSFNNRYGWIEIDPNNYKLISVLDTGEYGAMTETIITQTHIETTTRYFLGLLIGSNIAVGSVIDMALMTSDYTVIKKQGHNLAKTIGCYVKKFEAVSGDVLGTAKGAAKDEAKNQAGGGTGDAIENMINSTFDCKDGGSSDDSKPKEYKDFVNFGKGIDHAISEYFKSMK